MAKAERVFPVPVTPLKTIFAIEATSNATQITYNEGIEACTNVISFV